MADNRLIIDHSERLAQYAPGIIDNSTIVYDGTQINGAAATSIGHAVTLTAANTVALCADADHIYGVLTEVEWDGKCTIQIQGYVQLPGGVSALLTSGLAIVGALGAASAKGFVRGVVIATLADVAKGRGEIVDPTTTTAVWVRL